MRVSTLSIVAAAAPLIVSSGAHGGFVGLSIEQLPMDEFPGLLTWRVYAQFDERPGDFVFALSPTPLAPISIQVQRGTYFQHPMNTHGGGDLSPHPALCAADPIACRDTFVTIGKDTAMGDATHLTIGWPGFGPDSLVTYESGWFVTPDDPQGNPSSDNRVLILQLSTLDGVGFTGTVCCVVGFSNGSVFQQQVTFDTGCHTDVDGDNIVGIGDLLIVIAQWGPCPPTCPGDVTANGEVGIWDLLEVLANWGPCE